MTALVSPDGNIDAPVQAVGFLLAVGPGLAISAKSWCAAPGRSAWPLSGSPA